MKLGLGIIYLTFFGVILIVKDEIRFENYLFDILWCYINSEIRN